MLASKTSSPSAAVTVDPPVAVFVTDAQSNGGSLGLGQARIELYRFFDGARRAETVQVQPGDRIGRVADRRRDSSGSVDFTTDWYVVDILESQGDDGGATVLLRRTGDETIVVRSPRDDLSSVDRARFEDEAAPKTVAFFRGMLPYRNKILQVRWSGFAAWIPMGYELDVPLPPEDATTIPNAGDVLFYPGGVSEVEILFPYGPTYFASVAGPLAGNHFLTVVEGQEQFTELGRTVQWEGAQDVSFELA